jgi:hypothetical protein
MKNSIFVHYQTRDGKLVGADVRTKLPAVGVVVVLGERPQMYEVTGGVLTAEGKGATVVVRPLSSATNERDEAPGRQQFGG